MTVVGAMSAPLGGDRIAVEAECTRRRAARRRTRPPPPSRCPAAAANAAHYDVRLTVGEGAELRWLPEQLISAHGSDLRMRTRIDLAAGARLVFREEQVLGRHGEPPGTLASRLTVHRAGRPLLDQDLAYGPGAPGGWDGGAVLGGHRAAGQLLVVEPEFTDRPAEPRMLGEHAVLTPLAGPAFLVTALAPDCPAAAPRPSTRLSPRPCATCRPLSGTPSTGYRFGKETPVRPVHSGHTDERIPRQAQTARC